MSTSVNTTGFITGLVITSLLGTGLGIRKFFVKRELRLGTIYAGDLFGSTSLFGLIREILKNIFFFHSLLLFVLGFVYTLTLDDLSPHAEYFLIYLLTLGGVLLLFDLGGAKPWFVFIDWEPAGSAWRALFAANELYERISVMRIHRVHLWVFTAVALEGFNWIDRANIINTDIFSDTAMWSVSVAVWLGVAVTVLLVTRVGEIFYGSGILNFVDVLSLANISLAIVQSPGLVRYVHGKAPSGRGDWSSEELEKKLRDEAAGLLVKRGLFPEEASGRGDWQSFTLVNQEIGFQDKLVNAIRDLLMLHYAGRGSDRTYLVRKELGELLMTHIEQAGTSGNVRAESWGEKLSLSLPGENNVLLEDPSGLAWTDALLMGHSVFGFPVGEEFRLLVVELISFALVVRYQGSVYVGAAVGYAVNHAYLAMRNGIYKAVIARTTGIDQRFLL